MLQHRPTPAASPRRRAFALILGATGLLILLVMGTVLSLAALIHPNAADPQTPRTSVMPIQPAEPSLVSSDVAAARDALAARPMPDTGTGGAYGPQVSTRDPGTPIVLPPGTQIGAWGAITGYPRTPQGALAQLAAIDVAAFRSASMPGVRAVIRSWAAPGGPTPQTWSGVKTMASLLESIDVPGSGSPLLGIRATPAMGLIKGSIGPDFTVACIAFSIDVTYGGMSERPAVDCQRMLWSGDRWLIGPGREPAAAPNVWAGTDAAIDAGYRDLRQPDTAPELRIH
jgi:hypothetical protein